MDFDTGKRFYEDRILPFVGVWHPLELPTSWDSLSAEHKRAYDKLAHEVEGKVAADDEG